MSGLEQLGGYRIVELLGSGAMGEVYKAIDSKMFDRVVAVKVLSERLSRNEQARLRFRREVEVASRLSHTNVVNTYDHGEHEGRAYFVMQFVDGDDLSRVIADRSRSLTDRIRIAIQICAGLGHAHGNQVVHRDVKPSNIMISRLGERDHVTLVDFGIVHVEDSDLTHTVSQPGTYRYMSPEQLRAEPVGHRSDLFSLGIVLYELFSGVHPFDAPSEALTTSMMLREDPEPMGDRVPELPAELDQIVSRLLAKDPEARPPHAEHVLDELEQVLTRVAAGTDPGLQVATTPTHLVAIERVLDTGDTEQARRMLVDAMREDPTDGAARGMLDRVMSINAEGVPYREYRAALARSTAALRAGEWAGARSAAQEARELWPADPQWQVQLSQIDIKERESSRSSRPGTPRPRPVAVPDPPDRSDPSDPSEPEAEGPAGDRSAPEVERRETVEPPAAAVEAQPEGRASQPSPAESDDWHDEDQDLGEDAEEMAAPAAPRRRRSDWRGSPTKAPEPERKSKVLWIGALALAGLAVVALAAFWFLGRGAGDAEPEVQAVVPAQPRELPGAGGRETAEGARIETLLAAAREQVSIAEAYSSEDGTGLAGALAVYDAALRMVDQVLDERPEDAEGLALRDAIEGRVLEAKATQTRLAEEERQAREQAERAAARPDPQPQSPPAEPVEQRAAAEEPEAQAPAEDAGAGDPAASDASVTAADPSGEGASEASEQSDEDRIALIGTETARIQTALDRWKLSHERFDVLALRSVFPRFHNFEALQRQFDALKWQRLELTAPQIVWGDGLRTAEAAVDVTTEFMTKQGVNPGPRELSLVFFMQRSGEMWIIDRMDVGDSGE